MSVSATALPWVLFLHELFQTRDEITVMDYLAEWNRRASHCRHMSHAGNAVAQWCLMLAFMILVPKPCETGACTGVGFLPAQRHESVIAFP